MSLFSYFSGLDLFFFICALVGSILFLVRTVLQFIGGGSDVDGGADMGGHDFAHEGTGVDSDVSFKVLTLQGLTAFFMMFGLVGLAMHWKGLMNAGLSILGALAAGVGSVFLIQRLFYSAGKLQTSGNIELDATVGCEGTVYTNIPKEGTGSVQVICRNRLREFTAKSAGGYEIKTGENIKVVSVSGGVLMVEKGRS